MSYRLSIAGLPEKKIYPLGENFRGRSASGEEFAFTNYYMTRNGRPFFGVSGEFHFSRMSDARWEDELIKMKLCGLNIVSTYVLWNHHEEEEGVFDFSGRRDIRRFVSLCKKHGLYVILRVGPFAHGEARNGGLPDWLYGQPFEVRTTAPGFLACVRRLYARIGQETAGLYFQEDGPIIGMQLDNEYMHSSAPWEMTTGISGEWVFGGNEGEAYLHALKKLAAECGLRPAFYTCTGWGGAPVPEDLVPLWGGYAYRPWLFYSYRGEHPATEEYIYQDFHKDGAVCTNDFKPPYAPESRPYACCEMGGGMMCSYYYRFQLPYKSVDAMANIKLGSGCNFLGYYMFQGGSNPVGKRGVFLNEGQVPKISYDYQAALGEFGQERESYRRLKTVHYFLASFGERLCGLQTVLPEGASQIEPTDLKTLRFAARTDGKRGFLFVNNFQDHRHMPDREAEEVVLELEGGTLTWRFGIASEENAVLPFHFDLDGIDLVQASAQPVARIAPGGEATYVFMRPEGMEARFVFEPGTRITGEADAALAVTVPNEKDAALFAVERAGIRVKVLVLSRKLADDMFLLQDGRLVFTEANLLEDETGLRLETAQAVNRVLVYPKGMSDMAGKREEDGLFDVFCARTAPVQISAACRQTAANRYVLSFPPHFLDGCKDALLRIRYRGDIGCAFLGGQMIHDNFCNGAPWEIGLSDFAKELEEQEMTVYITPLREGVQVNVESAMAARREQADASVGALEDIEVRPVYEIRLERKEG